MLLSASLLALSFHPLGLHFLAWFSLVPVLFVIDKAKPSRAFTTGLIFGAIFALLSLFWIVFLQIPINVKILMIFGLLLLFLYLGLYFGVSFLITSHIGIWFLPLAVCGLEFVRGIGEIGFPWLSLGYSQARYPVMIQQASIYGIYGLSGWLVLLNVALYKALKIKKWRNVILTLLIFIMPVIYGTLRIKAAKGTSIVVGIIQPNIDPNLKFTRSMRKETFKQLMHFSGACIELARDVYNDSCDLIIWPESATPIFLKLANEYQLSVLEFVDSNKTAVLTGTPIYDSKIKQIYNGAVLMEPGYKVTQEYRKLHLVPFGEHIPFDRYIPLFQKIDLGEGDYSPGIDFTVFNIKNLKFSCLICFESIFPELSREFVKRDAQLLVNITNDGWFGKISGPQQHNDMAILRAVENGVPLARSANTGISMVVDKYGRILESRGLFEEGIIVHRIFIENGKTIYRVVGDIAPVISLMVVTILLLLRVIGLNLLWRTEQSNGSLF